MPRWLCHQKWGIIQESKKKGGLVWRALFPFPIPLSYFLIEFRINWGGACCPPKFKSWIIETKPESNCISTIHMCMTNE